MIGKCEKMITERYQQKKWIQIRDEFKFFDPKEVGIAVWENLKILTRNKVNAEEKDPNNHCVLCKETVDKKKIDKKDIVRFKNCGHFNHKKCVVNFEMKFGMNCLTCT